MGFIAGMFVGAVGASIGWFFVWRNNKSAMKYWMEKAEAKVDEKLDKKIDKGGCC